MIKNIIQDYLEALAMGDMEEIVSLFDTDGVVNSPLYGSLPAVEFYAQLESDTSNSRIELIALFEDTVSNKGVAHFIYHWTMTNGREVQFECADVFEFSEDNKITLLTILYDTASIKP